MEPKYLIILDGEPTGYVDNDVIGQSMVASLANQLIDQIEQTNLTDSRIRITQERTGNLLSNGKQKVTIYAQTIGHIMNGPVVSVHNIELKKLPYFTLPNKEVM